MVIVVIIKKKIGVPKKVTYDEWTYCLPLVSNVITQVPRWYSEYSND